MATSATPPSSMPKRSPNWTASHTASQPLAQSPTSVAIAAFLLPERRTLVAPGFFEP